MDLATFLRTLARHPWVIAVGLVLTIGAAAGAVQRVQPTFTTTGSVLLVPPSNTEDEAGNKTQTNPVRNIDASLITFGDIIASAIDNDATRNQLIEKKLSTDFKVNTESGTPIIDLSVQAGTAPRAAASYAELRRVLNAIIERKQLDTGAPSDGLIHPVVLTDASTTRSSGTKLRVGAAVFAIGSVLTVAAVLLVDMRKRSRRRARETARSADAAVPAESVPSGAPSSRTRRGQIARQVIRWNGPSLGQAAAQGNGSTEHTDSEPARESDERPSAAG